MGFWTLCILFPQGFALNFHHSKKHLGDASLAQSMHFLKGEGEGGHEGGIISNNKLKYHIGT